MGFELPEVPYIQPAESLGVGSADLEKAVIRELNIPQSSAEIANFPKFTGFAKYIDEREACSACYGSLAHALKRMGERGELYGVKSKLYIGQYYKGKCMDGIGIGSCTGGFQKHVKGCPPNAKEIIEYLEEHI